MQKMRPHARKYTNSPNNVEKEDAGVAVNSVYLKASPGKIPN